MIRGRRVTLRAREAADLPVLLSELYNDVATRARADSRPWLPVSPDGSNQPYSVDGLPDSVVCFSLVDNDEGALLGEALLWGLDAHNRFAHLGLSLRPGARGHGYAVEAIALLCDYGFRVRGLQRLQIDTLADNSAMRRVAEHNGFVHEGTLRQSAFVMGEFVDEVTYGLLLSEWAGVSGPDEQFAP